MKAMALAVALAALIVAQVVPAGAATKGDIDRSFGRDGIAFVRFPGAEYGEAIARAGSGFIVAGELKTETTSDIVVARLRGGGALDRSFSGDGRVRMTRGDSIEVLDVAVRSGSIAVLGRRTGDQTVVALLDRRGRPVPGFGTDGVTTVSLGSVTTPTARFGSIALDPQGRVMLGGTLTTHTGQDGLFEQAEDLEPFGLIDSVPRERDSAIVVRLEGAGGLDGSFGVGGRTVIDFGEGTRLAEIAFDAEGLLVAGTTFVRGYRFLLARLDAAGAVQPTFGVAGYAMSSLVPAERRIATGLAVGPRGIVVAGYTWQTFFLSTDFDPVVARFTPTGALDPTFHEDGINPDALPGNLVVDDVAVDDRGRTFLSWGPRAGFFSSTPAGIGAVRRDGHAMVNFGIDGARATPPGMWTVRDVTVDRSGPVVVGRADRRGEGPCGGFLYCLFSVFDWSSPAPKIDLAVLRLRA